MSIKQANEETPPQRISNHIQQPNRYFVQQKLVSKGGRKVFFLTTLGSEMPGIDDLTFYVVR